MRQQLTFILLVFSILICHGQRFTQDTVIINIEKDTIKKYTFSIEEIKDFRKEKEISVFSIRKFILLPVDVYVFPSPPIDSFLILKNTNGKKSYDINVLHFNISERKGNFSTTLLLDAKIAVFENEPDSDKCIGQLLYQTEYRKRRAVEKYPESCKKITEIWMSDFFRDMNTVTIAEEQSRMILTNLFTEWDIRDLYLNINLSSAIGTDWWLVDAELFFSHPEIKKRTVYVANIVRYQNHPQFESVSYGWKSEHIQYRLNRSLTFDGSTNILFGINKWKKIEEIKPGLEQLFNVNLSFTQSIGYKPDKNMFYGKLGIMENMFYIYDYGFKFRPGLYLTLGGKF